jgi:small subunit ribosomal protein S17
MRTKTGIITSAKMQDTVTVTVHRSVMHPTYRKRFRVSKKFLADSKGQDLAIGDEVVITECRPLSKRKCFRVTEVLHRAARVAEMRTEEIEKGSQRDHRDASYEKSPKKPMSPKSPMKGSSVSSDSSVSSVSHSS